MVQSPLEDVHKTQKRGARGKSCYTCRIRKVKCDGSSTPPPQSSSSSSGSGSHSRICANCHRLKFECRWTKPRPGEDYHPPPKKRRTFDHKDHKDHKDDSDREARNNGRPNSGTGAPPPITGAEDETNDEFGLSSSPIRAIDSLRLGTIGITGGPGPDLDSEAYQGGHGQEEDQGFPAHIEDYIPELNGMIDTPWDSLMGLDFFVPGVDLTLGGLYDTASGSGVGPGAGSGTATSIGMEGGLDPGSQTGPSDWMWNQSPSQLNILGPPPATAIQSHGQRPVDIREAGDKHGQMDAEERVLIQHYLEVMKSYAKVEDRKRETNNLYIHAFSKALSLPPLYDAILAYSSLHLSLSDPSRVTQAERYSAKASLSLSEAINTTGEISGEIEGLLAAIFILLKKEHMAATPSSLNHILHLLDLARQIVITEKGAWALSDPNGFARRVVLRLAFKDCRAAIFRLGGGGLIAALRNIPKLEIFNVDVSKDRLEERAKEIGGGGGGGSGLLRANLLRLKVAELEQRIHDSLHIDATPTDGLTTMTIRPVGPREMQTLRNDLEKEVERYEVDEGGDDSEEILSSTVYNHYVILGALHSALLYLYRVYPDPRWSPQPSIDRILSIHLSFHKDPSRTPTPSSILPISLFFAGLSTTDKIHRAWIIERYQSAASWGTNIGKTMELLREIWKRESREGKEVDIKGVMEETTGYLLM